MAKISLYQQRQLASSIQNPGGIDQSGSILANGILGATNALANTVQHAQAVSQSEMNQFMASSIGNLGQQINYGIRQSNQRKAELARDAEQLEKQKQAYRDETLTSNLQVQLSGVLDDLVAESESLYKNSDPKEAKKYFMNTVGKKLEDFYKQHPQLNNNDKVKADLNKFANDNIIRHRRGLYDFGEKQSDINNSIATGATTDDIVAQGGVKAPPNINPIGETALIIGQQNLAGRLPLHTVYEGQAKAEQTINKARLKHFKNWMSSNIDNSKDLRLAQDYLYPTERNGGVPKITQLDIKGIDTDMIDTFRQSMDTQIKKFDTRLQKDEQIITTQDNLELSMLMAPVTDDDGNYTPEQLAPIRQSLIQKRDQLLDPKVRPPQIKGLMGETLNNPTIQPSVDKYNAAIKTVNGKINDYKKEQDRIVKEGLSNTEKLKKEQMKLGWDAFNSSPEAQAAIMGVETSFSQLTNTKINGNLSELNNINAAHQALIKALPYMRDKDTGTPNADYLQKQALLQAKLNIFKDSSPEKINTWGAGWGGENNPVFKKIEETQKQFNQGATNAAQSRFPAHLRPAVSAYVNNSVAEQAAEFKRITGMEPDAHTMAAFQGVANMQTVNLPKESPPLLKGGKQTKEEKAKLDAALVNFNKNQKGNMKVPPAPKGVSAFPSVSDMHYLKPGVSAKRIAELKEEGILE